MSMHCEPICAGCGNVAECECESCGTALCAACIDSYGVFCPDCTEVDMPYSGSIERKT